MESASDRGIELDRGILVICVVAVAASFLLRIGIDGRVRLPEVLGSVATGGIPASCPSVLLLGARCPGCGMSRSFIASSRLEIRRALDYNVAGPFLFLLTFLQIPYRIYRIRARPPAPWATSPRLRLPVYGVIALMVGAWALELLR